MLCCVQVLRFLSERQKREPEAYDEWYKEFNAFIKEGKCCAVLCCAAWPMSHQMQGALCR
jgi:hypothetical protein